MQFDELDSGLYRIYGGALELPNGRYSAAVSVVRREAPQGTGLRAVFQDFRLAGGHGFESAAAALRFATQAGQDAIRHLPALRAATAEEALA